MSTDKGEGPSSQKATPQTPDQPSRSALHPPTTASPQTSQQSSAAKSPLTPTLIKEDVATGGTDERKPVAKRDQPSASTSPSTPDDPRQQQQHQQQRQVIAVSASKGPAAFFNLARKFLVTDEMCDLSALEGAIVSAVDAAHLLERSKMATIVRVQTSYVTVEPKRRKQQSPLLQPVPSAAASVQAPSVESSAGGSRPRQAGRELRRARIVITVKRTENYMRWLEENPLQAMMAGTGDDDEDLDDTAAATAVAAEDPIESHP